MRRLSTPSTLLGALALLAATAADACTTVVTQEPQRPVVGYNYDFSTDPGLVLVNKRGVLKSSRAEQNPARWESRYGSVTFVQFGRDNPMTGMNEAGLVVSQMWLDGTQFEQPDERPTVGVLEWLQLLLDTAASVEEALAVGAAVRIESRIPLHYALVDARGRAAFVEFLGGRRIVHTGDGLPHGVLTNSTYADSLLHLAGPRGGDAPNGSESLVRFARAATRLATADGADPIDHAFATLESAAQPGLTRWSIVYEPRTLVVRWRSQHNRAIRLVDFRSFDFSCRTPVRSFDVHAGHGDVGSLFEAYAAEANEALVLEAYARTPFLAPLGPEAARSAARFPDTARCIR